MELDFSPVWAGAPQLLAGALVTVEVTAAALLLGCVMGLLIGVGRLNPQRRAIYGLCTAYVAVIRGTPLLVQLFILFFGQPQEKPFTSRSAPRHGNAPHIQPQPRFAAHSISRDSWLRSDSGRNRRIGKTLPGK